MTTIMKKSVEHHTSSKQMTLFRYWKYAAIVLWGVLIFACFYYRDALSVSEILAYSPSNPLLAAFVMLLLFAFKSITVFLFCGLLYAASGMLFPLPVALIVNVIGTALMVSLPYILGHQMGSKAANEVTAKYPKAEQLRAFRQENDGFFALIARLIGVLPCDVVSFFMGAISVDYKKYLAGSILGLLPLVCTFTVMGMSITNPRSPAFIIALCVQIACMVASVVLYRMYIKRHHTRCRRQS